MGLYVFVTDNTMIDASSITYMNMELGKLTVILSGGNQLNYDGPFAIKMFDRLKTALERDNVYYDKGMQMLDHQESVFNGLDIEDPDDDEDTEPWKNYDEEDL